MKASIVMPKSKSSTALPQNKPFQKSEFVNYDLTKEDKDALKKLATDIREILPAITSLAKEGYKISVSWDDYSDCVAVFLIGQSETCVNHGFILTARAASIDKALTALLYKHQHVFEGVWHNRSIDGKSDDF